jgi:uncharacterized protein YpmS
LKNKWKFGFFSLLLLIFATIIAIAFLFVKPKEDLVVPENIPMGKENAKFEVKTSKKDLNKLIEYYKEKEFKSKMDYKVFMDKDVVLKGGIPVFTQELPFEMHFEPRSLENGDLILKQKSISLGAVSLPVSYIMKFIRDAYDLPNWITIQPDQELIYVSVTSIQLKSNLKVRVNRFNLPKDDINFTLFVPTEEK